ncbi:MAG: hypothetical protein HKO07_00685 [Pseudomonadales bacterium]|nr:hypothetical protein [Pseudomonadales bacterium]
MHVSPIYNTVGMDGAITMVTAWIAALGFTLQIYFDFSGYSDMAAGLALAIGVRLPINFDSPLKTSNIIDFWGRWHITLTRFLTAYVYNPIALSWTRRRLQKGKPGFSPAKPNVPAFIHLLALPTFITMLLSGLWHGAGYTFIIWGGLHGIYLCINHGWRLTAPGWFKSRDAYDALMRPLGFVITFFSVTVAMVWFRANDVPSALAILQGMTGANGIGLPEKLAALGALDGFSWIIAEPVTLREFANTLAWLMALALVALVMPNTYQLMSAQEPVLGYQPRNELSTRLAQKIQWRPTVLWFVAISIILATTMMRIGGQSEFLYWQF